MLRSQRLRCRPILACDDQSLFSLYADPRTSALSPLPVLTEFSEMRARREQWQRHWQEYGFGPMCLIDQATQQVIGIGGISLRDFSGETQPNLWYRLSPSTWGKGYASEFVQAYTQWFRRLNPQRDIHALVQEENLASKRILERLGMQVSVDAASIEGSVHYVLPWAVVREAETLAVDVVERRTASVDLRPMLSTDLPAVMAIQARCYGEGLQESLDCLAAKQQAAPTTCLVACIDAQVSAYIFALASSQHKLSTWNASATSLADSSTVVDCLYLHDLAVDPSGRGYGLAAGLIEAILAYGADQEWQLIQLVAVQNSLSFWRQYGFVLAEPTDEQATVLASFGKDAFLMRRALRS